MAEETDVELKARLGSMNSRDLARAVLGGNRRTRDAAEEILDKRGKTDKREVENIIIGCGGTPKNIFRRLTGW